MKSLLQKFKHSVGTCLAVTIALGSLCSVSPASGQDRFTPTPPTEPPSISPDDLEISTDAERLAQAKVIFDVPIDVDQAPDSFTFRGRGSWLPPYSLWILCAASVKTSAAGEPREYAPLLSERSLDDVREFLGPDGNLGTSYAAGFKVFPVTTIEEMPTVVTVFAYDENPGSDYSGAPYECFSFFNDRFSDRGGRSDTPRQSNIDNIFRVFSFVVVDEYSYQYAPSPSPDSVFHVKGTLP